MREKVIHQLISAPPPSKTRKEEGDMVKIVPLRAHFQEMKRIIIEECGESVFKFISAYVDLIPDKSAVISTCTRFNILNLPLEHYQSVINLKKINDVRYLNKFFEAINFKLEDRGWFVGCAETKMIRKKRILSSFPTGINLLVYSFDFIFRRIFPKVSFTKRLYYYFTQGQNRVITRTEILGRLLSCGFEIIEERLIEGTFFWVVRRAKEPAFDYSPTYGPLIRLHRVGKNREMITVYKFRTMHPYSEYLQHYVYARNDLEAGGKFRDDYRVTTLGKVMRKFWIDELPMLVNWLYKRNLKLVGVRPLSKHYFNLYTKELQDLRTKFKPGLIPPFYADDPKTIHEIMASEKRYLEAYMKHPFRTDFVYFWRAVYNILFMLKRSH
ncbi:MAG: sugar transferase [Bacteroidetes bacterium]|nr:sugar transferase [Bacteroidota bacterium]